MRIVIDSDHNGHELRRQLSDWLRSDGHEVDDRGPADDLAGLDYPPLCSRIAEAVLVGMADRGMFVGGTGHGEVIMFNRFAGIRAGRCLTIDDVLVSRGNNDSNVLVLGAKNLSAEQARDVTSAWLTTPFRQGDHARRLRQIDDLARQLPSRSKNA